MKLIVLSSPTAIPNELDTINALFAEGLEYFHVHKPAFTKGETEKFIRLIPEQYQDRVYLHSYFQKFHSLEELRQYRPSSTSQLSFLSPVFDSISKEGYKSEFSERMNRFIQLRPELIEAIHHKNVVALGGVDEDKIELLRKVGFAGAASLGAVWYSKDPVAAFCRMRDICNSKAFLRRELFLAESQESVLRNS